MVSEGNNKAFTQWRGTCPQHGEEHVHNMSKRQWGNTCLTWRPEIKGGLLMVDLLELPGDCLKQRLSRSRNIMDLRFAKTPSEGLTQQEETWMLQSMQWKKCIIATFHYNVKSVYPAKQHQFSLPRGLCLCKWQQDAATGTSTCKDDNCLPKVFLEVPKALFVTLSDSILLGCVYWEQHQTNECVNFMVCVWWSQKHKHHGVKSSSLCCGISSL